MTPAAIPGRRTRQRTTAPANTAVAYLRVSTGLQADSGNGIEAQRTAVTAYAEKNGLTIIEWHTDAGISGSIAPSKRPAMSEALQQMKDHQAHILIAAKLDRVSRSVKDGFELREQADREGWLIRTTDGVMGDDDSPMGRAMMGIASVFSQMERELISMRTREALAELKAKGVQLGQPTELPDDVIARIITELSCGDSLRTIAQGLMDDGIPTGKGGTKWYPQQVKRAADSQRGRAMVENMFHMGRDENGVYVSMSRV